MGKHRNYAFDVVTTEVAYEISISTTFNRQFKNRKVNTYVQKSCSQWIISKTREEFLERLRRSSRSKRIFRKEIKDIVLQ